MRNWLPPTIALFTLAIRFSAGPWPIDDAYITFRYARNAVNGLGLVYNPDQSVLGTSTPAFALLLALISGVTGADIPWAALAVSALADAITVLLICQLAQRLRLPSWSALMCSLTWALYPLGYRYAIGGMETSLASVLILSALTLHLAGHEGRAALLAGFAVLTRPDALAAAFVILLAQALRTSRLPWRSILILTAVLFPWLIFATWQYGTPLPQSLQAKSHAVYLALSGENALQILYQIGGLLLAGPMGLAAQGMNIYLPPERRALPLTAGVILSGLWGLGALQAIRADRRWAAFFAIPPLFAGTYALLGLRGNLMAEWYLVPLAPLFFLGIFGGTVSLCRRFGPPLYPSLAIAVCCVILMSQVAGLNLGRLPGRSAIVPRIVWTEREELYRKAAEFLKPRLRAGEVVAASEIGALGYYCDCQILDTVGLISPEALEYYPLPLSMYVVNYAVPPNLIREKTPTYVVSLDVFIRSSLLRETWFLRDYGLDWEAETRAFGSRRLLVFRRAPQGEAGGGQ